MVLQVDHRRPRASPSAKPHASPSHPEKPRGLLCLGLIVACHALFYIVSGADTPRSLRPLRITIWVASARSSRASRSAAVLHYELMRAVVGVEIIRQVAQIVHQRMRRALRRALLTTSGKALTRLINCSSCGSISLPKERKAMRNVVREPALLQLPHDARRRAHAHIECSTRDFRWIATSPAPCRNPDADRCCA